MARRSNKLLEATLTAAEATTATKDEDDLEIQRKVGLAIKGFTTSKYRELVLKDRIRLSKENALVICNYSNEKGSQSQAYYNQDYNSISI
jgi:hypothetical protein